MPFDRRPILAAVAAAALLWALPAAADTTLLNVSYDPTRELYQEFNAAFAEKWERETGERSRSRCRTAALASRRAP